LGPVDYQDPATRFAYVYKYVAAHGDYIVQVLQEFRDERGRVFGSENARVSCIGGGPGSDVIGVLKYLDENRRCDDVSRVTFYLLDREQAWADTWTELDESLSMDIHLNTNFQPLDVTNPESWRLQRKFLQADLFTMSYFVSEVFSLDRNGVVADFWAEVFRSARPGALFLYIDNGHSDFDDYYAQQCDAAGLVQVIGSSDVRLIPRYSEQASDLGCYLSKFGQHPKIQATVTYKVLQKP
jgi:hypothetical protein